MEGKDNDVYGRGITKMHFVVPLAYSHSIFNNDELRFMLRSLEKNYMEDFKVTVICDRLPEWCDPDNVIIIDRKKVSVDYENFYDTLEKLKHISFNCEFNEFVYIYDDICLLKQIDKSFFYKCYYIETSTTNKKWLNTIEKSLSLIPGKDFESHIPVLFDRLKLKFMFRSFPYSTQGVPYAPISLYFNLYGSDKQLLNGELCYNEISDSIWLNYIDKYFLNLGLDKLFTKKSRYEKNI